MFQKILIPLDGSQAAEHALDYLDSLQAKEILLVNLYTVPLEGSLGLGWTPVTVVNRDTPNRNESLKYLQSVRDKLTSVVTANMVCGCGDPAEAILEIAETAGCDLILMTSHGRSGFKRFLMGSVAEKVARHATCPVLMVGRQANDVPLNQVAQSGVDTEKYFAQSCL